MRARSLDRRLVIQKVTRAQDSFGQPVETWSERATVAAQKIDIIGRERFASEQTIAEETTVFRIRYRKDVTAQDRLICEGKTYDITGLAELGRRDGLDITAVAVVP